MPLSMENWVVERRGINGVFLRWQHFGIEYKRWRPLRLAFSVRALLLRPSIRHLRWQSERGRYGDRRSASEASTQPLSA